MIINKTKKQLLAKEHSIYKGILQLKGLMFSKRKAAVFTFSKPRKVSVHMMFVFYPIDVLFLDSENKVIEKKTGLKPFSFCKSACEAKYMIELPNDGGKSVSIGDVVSFK